MENKIIISVVLIAVLLASTLFMGLQLYWPKTGNTVATNPNQDYQGYSSYEEMMKAHHGGSVASSGSCGMEDGPPSTASGKMTDYGITLDTDGYNKLLQMTGSISLTAEQANKIVGLNILLPCCGVQEIVAEGNCGCGHHQAMIGLAKLLVTKGYSREQMQAAIDEWKTVFYPNGAESGAGSCG